MGHADEGIVLTDRERELLAELAGTIGDPWLARQLTGGEAFSGKTLKRRRRPDWLHLPHVKALSGWAGVAIVGVGAAVAVATFTMSIVLAALGLVVMGFGLWRVAVEPDGIVARWVASRRAEPQPETPVAPPSPPRTPPAAA